jgi:hypothetical protein
VVGVRISATKTQTSSLAHGVTIRNLSSLLAAMVVENSPPSEIAKFLVRGRELQFQREGQPIFPISIRLLSGDHLDEDYGKEPDDVIPLVVGPGMVAGPISPRTGEVWP